MWRSPLSCCKEHIRAVAFIVRHLSFIGGARACVLGVNLIVYCLESVAKTECVVDVVEWSSLNCRHISCGHNCSVIIIPSSTDKELNVRNVSEVVFSADSGRVSYSSLKHVSCASIIVLLSWVVGIFVCESAWSEVDRQGFADLDNAWWYSVSHHVRISLVSVISTLLVGVRVDAASLSLGETKASSNLSPGTKLIVVLEDEVVQRAQ